MKTRAWVYSLLVTLCLGAAWANGQVTIYVSRDGYCGGHTPCYFTIQDGIDSVSVPSIIKITQETYHENVVLDVNQIITLEGGWDTSFTSFSSHTIIAGSLTIPDGTMILGVTGRIILSTPPPTITSFTANPGTVNFGQSSTLSWSITNAISASIDQGVGSVDPAGGSIDVSPATTTTYALTATNATGSDTTQVTVTVIRLPIITSLTVTPQTINLGESVTLAWIISDATSASIDQGVGSINPSSGSITVTPVYNTTYTLTATNSFGSVTAQVSVTVTGGIPPDPKDVAPEIDPTVATTVFSSTQFLYTGPDPIQTGVALGTIDSKRVAVLRGKVLDRNKNPLSGVMISILNHPEYGQTLSRLDGMFDMSVNGGGYLTVDYQKVGYLPAQRHVKAPWQDYTWLPDVALIQLDARLTPIDLAMPNMKTAQGSKITDDSGTRQATLLFSQGTTANLVMPNGSTQPISTLAVRASEYTVGPNGRAAMPGELPLQTAYTYAVALSVDEAIAAGAKTVSFSQPVYGYLENFIGFPVGTHVPSGYYDRDKSAWIPTPDGRVIKILSVTGGMADLDTNGDGLIDTEATLAALEITETERMKLAELYPEGTTLWRVPLDYFSNRDWNYPWKYPDGAIEPDPNPISNGGDRIDDPCRKSGFGTIECQNQVFSEVAPVVGTPFTLNYVSNRVPGHKASNTLTIPLIGATVPPNLQQIELEIFVAGRKFAQSFPPTANQTHTFLWDGLDAYGRPLQGRQPATVRIGYTYQVCYTIPPAIAKSFGMPSDQVSSGCFTGRGVGTRWHDQQTFVGLVDTRDSGLGAWTLNIHHLYDPSGQTLYLGSGAQRRAENIKAAGQGTQSPSGNFNSIITTVAGTGAQCDLGADLCGDGGPAAQAPISTPGECVVGPDGSLYIADSSYLNSQWSSRIRRVGLDGMINSFAGGRVDVDDCDGKSALEMKISDITDIDQEGRIYFSHKKPGTNGQCICRINLDKTVTRVAGLCDQYGFSGDGGPAVEAKLGASYRIGLGPDGSLYIGDEFNRRIRRVGPDGVINTIAGNGVRSHTGDGGPASKATIDAIFDKLNVGPDGTVYFIEGYGSYPNNKTGIRQITPDGIIQTIVDISGLETAGCLRLSPNGSFYICGTYENRIWNVTKEGVISAVVGTGEEIHAGDYGLAINAGVRWPIYLAFSPDGSYYIVEDEHYGEGGYVRRVGPAMTGFTAHDVSIASEDGGQVYQFDANGRHLKTVHALTGAMLYQFGYDTGNRLISITDGDGNVTMIERDLGGDPTAIVGPYGQRTTLALTAEGFLQRVTNPAGEFYQFGYGSEGLLTSVTGPRGYEFSMTYDPIGRLVSAQDPAGGSASLSRVDVSSGRYDVTSTTGMGRVTTYSVQNLTSGNMLRVNTFPDGTQAQTSEATDGTTTTTLPDGTIATQIGGPDPRFGLQASITKSSTTETPGGLSLSTNTTRSVTLTDPLNPLSLNTMTDTVTVKGRVSSNIYDAASRTFTLTSAQGRQTTSIIDAIGRPVRSQMSGFESINLSYDSRGRLSATSTGTGVDQRSTTYSYNADGYLETITDSLGRTRSLSYNAAGRLAQQAFSDGRTILYNADSQSNMISITPPGRPAHVFTYSPVDLQAQYTPPDIEIGTTSTIYSYNTDRQLIQVSRPDGSTIDLAYDSTTGRQSSVSVPGRQVSYAYNPQGKISTITIVEESALSYIYDGSLLTSETWSGAAAGSVGRTYNGDFRVQSINVNGGNTINFLYDNDGLLSQAGDITFTRNAQNGLLTGSTLGNVTDSWTYNGFGERSTYTASFSGGNIYSAQFVHDKLGRITQKTETIGGVTDNYGFLYDPAGRLSEVTKNSVTVSTYTYDNNGNRLTYSSMGETPVNGSYDNQDRLLQYGNIVYQYNASGDLISGTEGGQTTLFQYDALGNFKGATLPSGSQIEYLVDGVNRRIGKKVNGAAVKGFLYQDGLCPVAELDGSNNIVSLFVYGSRANVPDYMVKAGVTYRLISDHLGSPRLVVDISTGTIAQRLDYDEFGRVLLDTGPGFQPFGFAGGLYDPDTGLVRFGARDYNPESGRWTTKDPILFKGSSTNLYAYIGNNPINKIDLAGLGPGGHRYYRKPKLDDLSFNYTLSEKELSALLDDPEKLEKYAKLEQDLRSQIYPSEKPIQVRTLIQDHLRERGYPLRPDEFIKDDGIYRYKNTWDYLLDNLTIEDDEDPTDMHNKDYTLVWSPFRPVNLAKGTPCITR